MARSRAWSNFEDDVMKDHIENEDFEDSLRVDRAASYPGASAPQMWWRPEPPKAPCRRPSTIPEEWEVPPLELPHVPRKWSSSMSGDTMDVVDGASTLEEQEDEDDYDERGVFSLDGDLLRAADDDVGDGVADLGHGKTVSFDAFDEDFRSASTKNAKTLGMLYPADISETTSDTLANPVVRSRNRMMTMPPVLGASPMLLSVLEQVASESTAFRRPRFETA